MTKHHDIALYFVSMGITLLIFLFCTMFLVVSAEGTHSTEDVFLVTYEDKLHTKIDAAGSQFQLDYTPFVYPEQIRRRYAPILTPRLALTVQYTADYLLYWGNIFYNNFQEYLFIKETN